MIPRTQSAMAVDRGTGSCGGGEAFALRVLGQSMAPEFAEGEIIIVEPEGLAREGSYVSCAAKAMAGACTR
jgi:DNA polymerase V